MIGRRAQAEKENKLTAATATGRATRYGDERAEEKCDVRSWRFMSG
jgi:hypothetical protein